MKDNAALLWLTPSLEEQIIRLLSGLCPHNAEWVYDGHSHNESAYRCILCGYIGYY